MWLLGLGCCSDIPTAWSSLSNFSLFSLSFFIYRVNNVIKVDMKGAVPRNCLLTLYSLRRVIILFQSYCKVNLVQLDKSQWLGTCVYKEGQVSKESRWRFLRRMRPCLNHHLSSLLGSMLYSELLNQNLNILSVSLPVLLYIFPVHRTAMIIFFHLWDYISK